MNLKRGNRVVPSPAPEWAFKGNTVKMKYTFRNKKNITVSTHSAFRTWTPSPKPPNIFSIFMDLVESNQIEIRYRKKVLTPFEGALWLEFLQIKIINGSVKIVNQNYKGLSV